MDLKMCENKTAWTRKSPDLGPKRCSMIAMNLQNYFSWQIPYDKIGSLLPLAKSLRKAMTQ